MSNRNGGHETLARLSGEVRRSRKTLVAFLVLIALCCGTGFAFGQTPALRAPNTWMAFANPEQLLTVASDAETMPIIYPQGGVLESLRGPGAFATLGSAPSGVRLNSPTLFHEEGAPFSGAMIDPFEVHHAHIEDEQRINFGLLRGFRDPDGARRSALGGSLEMAYAYGDSFTLGTEAVIPFTTTGDSEDLEVGDIEFWPVKYSFVRKPEEVASVYITCLLPTGSESRGIGGGALGLGGILLYDRTWGNVYWGSNLEYLGNVTGATGSEYEAATAFAYSFIDDTPENGMAPSLPKQAWVLSVSLEFVYSRAVSGEESGAGSTTMTPGCTLWKTDSGWQVHLGYRVPTSGDLEYDGEFLIQIGNHFNWGRVLGSRTE